MNEPEIIQNGKFKEIEENIYWKPENIGENISGQVTKITESPYGTQWEITGNHGSLVTPGHIALQNKMRNEDIGKGDFVVIQYTGEKTSHKGSPTRLYRVWVQEVKK